MKSRSCVFGGNLQSLMYFSITLTDGGIIYRRYIHHIFGGKLDNLQSFMYLSITFTDGGII